ncbi:protein kinase [Candidatus Uabimicrobium amorphum]|uniref:Protein kinase n=1 Tax=Uabimicrobium amorphum TaxID=2596890 RepID=A0A5S9F611_UABAM|nr:serine/threonine-protein kinase [Candidatus Uabimicrobium amorphum]BBM87212.1 protein kinase [Candidatus Uabimicrobium amorphum]
MDEKRIQQLWSKTIGAEQLEKHGGGATYKAESVTAETNVYLPLMTLLNEGDAPVEVVQPQKQQGDETINETAVRPFVVEQETAVDENSPLQKMPLDTTLDDNATDVTGQQTIDEANTYSSQLAEEGAQTIDDPQSQAILAAAHEDHSIIDDGKSQIPLEDGSQTLDAFAQDASPLAEEGAQTIDDPQSQAILAAAHEDHSIIDDGKSQIPLEDGSQTLDEFAQDASSLAEEGAQTIDDPQSQAILAAAHEDHSIIDDGKSHIPLLEDGSQTLDAPAQHEISDLEKGAQTLFADEQQTEDEKDISGEQTIIDDEELASAITEKQDNYKSPQSATTRGNATTHGLKETLHEGVKSKLSSMRSENFVIGTEIARGGMGIINRGEQKSLKRKIAIKRIIPGSINNTTQQKFISEALVTAYLDHPNIVPVYELGKDTSGDVFLTMKLVKGVEWKKSLNKTAEDERFNNYDLEAHLRTLIDVCDAMAFAHNKGIVHNDLKPENIMIGEFGEVLVMDWGLAVSLEEISTELRTLHKSMVASPMGTPHYMSPELAEGHGNDIGPWTDTYLLGAMLYEIVTGIPPHYDENIWKSLMKAIASDPPTFDHKRDDLFPDEVPQELKSICTKSLAKNPEDRYQSVRDFKEAISHFLKHRESLIITREGQKILGENEQKLSKQDNKIRGKERNYLYAQYSKAVSCFEQALKLWSGNTAAGQGRFDARLAYSKIALKNDDLGLSEAQIDELDSQDPQVQKVRKEIHLAKEEKIRAQKSSQRIRILLAASILVTFIVLSVSLYFIRQQHLLAEKNAEEAKAQEKIARANAQEAQEQRDIAQRETKEAQRQHQRAEQSAKEAEEAALKAAKEARRADAERAKARREERIRFAEAKAAKKTLAKISLQKASEAFDTQQWKDSILFAGASLELTKGLPLREVRKIREQNKQFIKLGLMKEGLAWETTPHYRAKLSHIASSVDGRMLASTTGDSAYLWDANTGRLNNIFQESSTEFLFAAFRSDNKEIATVSKDHCIYLWSIEENGSEKLLRGHRGEITAALYKPNGDELISIAKDKTIRIWDTTEETVKKTIACNEIARDSLNIFLRDYQLVYLSTDGKLVVWNLSTGEKEYVSNESYNAITLHPSGKSVVVAGNKAIQVIALGNLQKRKTLGNFNKKVNALAYSDDGKLIITSSQEIIVVDSSSFKVTETKECDAKFRDAHYNKYLQAVIGLEEYARIYPLSQSKLKDHEELFYRPQNIECLRYSPNMKTIAITSDNLLQLFDKNGKYISQWQNNAKIRDIAYHPSSAFIAAASSDNHVYMWSTSKRKAQKLISHDGEITMLRVAPNQRLYATVAKDNVICLWDTQGQIVHYLEGHTAAINDIDFQQNSEYIVSTGDDKTVRIWNVKTGREQVSFTTNAAMHKVRYSPDGKKIVACAAKTLFLWNVQNEKLVRRYSGHQREITSVTFDRSSRIICSGDKDKKYGCGHLQIVNPGMYCVDTVRKSPI